jgi:hypothetical protein
VHDDVWGHDDQEEGLTGRGGARGDQHHLYASRREGAAKGRGEGGGGGGGDDGSDGDEGGGALSCLFDVAVNPLGGGSAHRGRGGGGGGGDTSTREIELAENDRGGLLSGGKTGHEIYEEALNERQNSLDFV